MNAKMLMPRKNKRADAALRIGSIISLILLCTFLSFGQTTYTATTVDLLISGTSTLHNWEMKSVKANCVAVLDFNSTGQITTIHTLSFSTPANTLKSEHTAMDNNAYKALRTDKDPLITYTMTSVTILPATAGASFVKCTGKLTIAGVTRDEDIVALCKPNADNTIIVTGSKAISMKDFNMEPPTFMLGTIKTGNDIMLTFTLIFKK